MKKFLVIVLQYFIAFGVAGFLVWLSLRGLTGIDKADIRSALLRANHSLVIPVFALLLVSQWVRAIRWKQIIAPMGYKPPVFDLLCGLFIGYLANQLIPRAGEIIRCTVVSRKEKIPVEKLIGTVVTERAIDVATLLFIGVIVFFLEYFYIKDYTLEILSSFKSWLQNSNKIIHLAFVLAVLAIIFLIFIIIKRKSAKWRSIFSRILKGLWEGLLSIRKIDSKFAFIVYTIIIWSTYIGAVWIGCFALKETMHLRFGASLAILVFGTVGIIIAPGGLGAYPYAIQRTLIFYGINKNIAIAFGWLLWLAQFLFVLIFGTAAYIAINIRKRKNENHSVHST